MSGPATDLSSKARGFARQLERLLNGTVCNGAHVGATVVRPDRMIVGTAVKAGAIEAVPVPVALGNEKPRVWLTAQYTCFLNDEGHLTVHSSVVSADPSEELDLCHVDYERGKEPYPEAHIQIPGTSETLGALADLWAEGDRAGETALPSRRTAISAVPRGVPDGAAS